LLRPNGRVEFTHNKAAIGILAASTDNALIFLSRDNRNCRIRRDRRHGFVGLTPCFSRALAPVSAESRHEGKQSFMLRIRTLICNSENKGKKASGCTKAAHHYLHNQSRPVRPRYQPCGGKVS
jgi:hypothetical protein